MESMDTSNAVFSIGADKKMTMSLDDIIKTNSKGKKQRKVGKSAVMNNQDSKKKRQKQLVSSVTKRASSLRQNRVEKMRGISTSNNNNNTNNKPMRVTRTSGRFLVKKRVTESPRAVRAKRLSTGAANTRVRGAVTTWSAQQRQRRQNASKKIAKAKQTSVTNNYTFSTGTNQDKRQTRGLLNKRTSRSESNANNSRNNTRQAANERRGIAQKGSNIKITTLNERFTNVRSTRGNNNTGSGRGSTRGSGRGSTRGSGRGQTRGGNINNRSNKSGPGSVRPTSTSSRGRGRGGNNNTRGNSNRGGRGRGRARN